MRPQFATVSWNGGFWHSTGYLPVLNSPPGSKENRPVRFSRKLISGKKGDKMFDFLQFSYYLWNNMRRAVGVYRSVNGTHIELEKGMMLFAAALITFLILLEKIVVKRSLEHSVTAQNVPLYRNTRPYFILYIENTFDFPNFFAYLAVANSTQILLFQYVSHKAF